ncbi:MAG: FHA domain-containing protein [Polyangiaceae bacterium]|jgi:hypothetical protein
MAILRNTDTGRTKRLEAEHVIGRGSHSALRLVERFVSSQHASLRWTGERWELKDLSSTNGTFVNGSRIEPATHQLVAIGDRIAFGRRKPEWELIDVSPPVTMAVPFDDAEAVLADQDLIAIPSSAEPIATIYRCGEGGWILEQSMSATPIVDQQIFSVDSRRWKFCRPAPLYKTSLTSFPSPELVDLALTFYVSRDEEYTRVRAMGAGREFELGAHSYHYLLLTLARRRLADLAEGVVDSSSGWVYQEDLSRDPSMAPPQLNLDVFRARKQFAALGIVNAANVIERRPRTRQLRIGTSRVRIVTL